MTVSSVLQEDVETSLENLQDMDMMDISVLDEADIDNGSVADCVEEEEEATLPEGLADSTELVEGDLKGLPEQLQEHAVSSWCWVEHWVAWCKVHDRTE